MDGLVVKSDNLKRIWRFFNRFASVKIIRSPKMPLSSDSSSSKEELLVSARWLMILVAALYTTNIVIVVSLAQPRNNVAA